MLFYFAVVGIALVVWLVYAGSAGVGGVINVSILGILAFALVLLGAKRGWERGRAKEIYFILILILLYQGRRVLTDLLITIFNFFRRLVVSQLLNRGISDANLQRGDWNPDTAVRTNMDLIFFFVGVVLAYVLTSTLKGGPPRDVFGAVLGMLGMILMVAYSYNLLRPFLDRVLGSGLLEGARVDLPDIRLPDFRVSGAAGLPFVGWDRWLPILVVLVVTVYYVFFAFLNPPRRKGKDGKDHLNLVPIIGIVVLLGVVWFFAVQNRG
jgi:hypothetical protein